MEYKLTQKAIEKINDYSMEMKRIETMQKEYISGIADDHGFTNWKLSSKGVIVEIQEQEQEVGSGLGDNTEEESSNSTDS